MNKQIFYMVLKENQISPNIVHFGGQKEGAFCIKKGTRSGKPSILREEIYLML